MATWYDLRDPYAALGVRQVINVATTLTAIGGSTIPEEVLRAMNAAANWHVDMRELHEKAGDALAEMTRNEAAYVTTGCAAAISLAVLACATGGSPERIARVPFGLERSPNVIMHRAHRMPYDRAIELVGARIRDIGNVIQTFPWELDSAIDEATCAVLWVAGSHFPPGALGLPETVAIAHAKGVPVIVDAAAQLPPVSNLWYFTQDIGADLALFSGGKALRGPQASGLMVGKRELISAARANGSPNQYLARALKVGKEEICGLVAAVQRYLARDHEADLRTWELCVERWVKGLEGIPGVVASRSFPNEAGRPVPRLEVQIDLDRCGFGARELERRLWEGEPRVAVLRDQDRAIFLTPDTLDDPAEEDLVLEVLLRALGRR